MKLLGKVIVGLIAIIVVAVIAFVIWSNYRIAATELRTYDDGAPGRYVMFEGHRWHYLTKGNVSADPTGAPVLLLHGFILSGQESFGAFSDELAKDRGVIAPDYLGYGHSERVVVPGAHYEITHTAGALAAILDEQGVRQVDVIGHSYGGVVAAQFALDYPQRVRRIVFMSSAQYVDISGTRLYEAGLGVGRAMTWHLVSGPLSFLGNSCRSNPKCTWWTYGLIEDSTDSMRAAMSVNLHSATLAALPSRLKEIAAPSLILIGDRDLIVPIAHAEQLLDQLEDAKLAIIEGGRHMPYGNKLDDTYEAVASFLQPSM